MTGAVVDNPERCSHSPRHLLRAPAGDNEKLIEPPWPQAASLLAENIARRELWNQNAHGLPHAEIAAQAKNELLAAAHQYTSRFCSVARPQAPKAFILAGHQPELFHPGVWFKNFALMKLARDEQAAAVNLLIDSDTVKQAALHVPSGEPDRVHMELIPFDAPSAQIPYEDRDILDPETMASFASRCSQSLERISPQPLLESFWPRVLERARETRNLGACLAQARRQLEGEWGLETLELPQSHVCQFESFRRFAAHLLSRAEQFRAVYNNAITTYRAAHHVRSVNHPAPLLAQSDDWTETPFWVWTREEPRRRSLFARQAGKETILTDRDGWEFRLPLTSEGDYSGTVNAIANLEKQGIRLRTRALATTLFARLYLSDLFLHGIGGGKYDQVSDRIIEGFFGVEAPAFMVLSATVRLPVTRPKTTVCDLHRVESLARELTYHPEQHLPPVALSAQAAASAVHDKRRWIAEPPTAENARTRCRGIRDANEALQPLVAAQREDLSRLREQMREELRRKKILGSRELAFCLYPEPLLREFLLGFLNEA